MLRLTLGIASFLAGILCLAAMPVDAATRSILTAFHRTGSLPSSFPLQPYQVATVLPRPRCAQAFTGRACRHDESNAGLIAVPKVTFPQPTP